MTLGGEIMRMRHKKGDGAGTLEKVSTRRYEGTHKDRVTAEKGWSLTDFGIASK